MRRSPFSALKQEVVPVVTAPDGSCVWFVSTGSIDPNTNPIPLQDKQKKQAEVTALILQASDELARQRGITSEEARGLFFPDKEDKVSIALNPMDYLTFEEKAKYFALVGESEQVPITVATLFMQHRLAYDLVLTENAKAKSRQLYVKEPWFDLVRGQVFKFEGFDIQITEPYDAESKSIGVTAIAGPLSAGAVGFLLKPNHKDYAMGDKSWTEEQTMSLSLENADGSESQIQAIYKFYLRESGKLTEDDSEKKSLPPTSEETSKSISSLSLSTGECSTGECNLTESTTIDSPMKTLETVPVG